MAPRPPHDWLTLVSAAAARLGIAGDGDEGELGASGAGASSPSNLVPPGPTRSRGTNGSGEVSRIAPTLFGKVRRNWAPIAGRPHAVSQPPCRFASSIAIARPSPVPPTVRARAASPRQKRWKTCLAWLASNPTPWSRTAIATAASSAFDQDVDGVALAVLDRVDQEVAQYPLDPPRIDLGLGLTAFMHGDLGVGTFRPVARWLRPRAGPITQVDLARR